VAALYRPVTNGVRLTILAGLLAIIAGLDVGLITRQPTLAGIAATAITFIGSAIAWRWLLAADHRAGLELVLDHDRRERREWKRETGTSIPTNARAAQRWLQANAAGDSGAADARASMLLRVGRLEEADEAIAAVEPRSPDEAFGLEIGRKTREHMGGGRPDMAQLHASWRELADESERARRRECLAFLDAMIAVADGVDAWPLLARARAEIGHVHRSSRMPSIVARWFAYQAVLVALVVWLTSLLAA
jgi:hypothetical protein